MTQKENTFGDLEKILQYFGLEQFYNQLPENVRDWVLDRPDISTVTRATEIDEQFVTRQARGAKDGQNGKFDSRFERPKFPPISMKEDKRGADAREGSPTERKETEVTEAVCKRFEARQPCVCYMCQNN